MLNEFTEARLKADIEFLMECFRDELSKPPLDLRKGDHLRKILIAELAFLTGTIETEIECDLDKLHGYLPRNKKESPHDKHE